MIWANVNHCPKKLSAHGHGDHDSNHSNHDNHKSNMDSNNFTSLGSIPEEDHQPNGAIAHSRHQSPPSESDHCKNLVDHDNHYKSNM